MFDSSMAVSLIPGDGVVARFGSVMAVVRRDQKADPDEIGALLQLCRESREHGQGVMG